ncbi:MAG: hypothetical protein D6675_10215 [Gemmatimonadetes bacterium]|nr:MAG: hypothetical protein D6675_10215 [Gemmatimonadota bacterium]
MKDQLIEIMPEFLQIKDEDVRNKTLAVWEEALTTKGWTIETLQRMPFTLLADNVQVSFIEHVRVVCQMCIAIKDVLVKNYDHAEINSDHLIAGAMLADVGKVWENDEVGGKFVKSLHGKYLRHPFTGVMLAHKHGLPDPVLHVIAVHSKEGDGFKRTPEAIIFHHADFVDFDLVR